MFRKLIRLYERWRRRKWIHFFCSCDDGEHDWCTDPDLLLIAIREAREAMSYSNWHTSKFDIIEEILEHFYKENNIPMRLNNYFRKTWDDGRAHWCPGCKEMHVIPKTWNFNGDIDKATFSPSVRITWAGGYGPDRVNRCCHYFLTDGILHFCSDSTHELAGKSVPLPELPEEFKPEDEDQVIVEDT